MTFLKPVMDQGCAEAAANIIPESDSTNQRLFLIPSGQIESGAPHKDTGDTHRRASRVVSCNFCPEASPASWEEVAPAPWEGDPEAAPGTSNRDHLQELPQDCPCPAPAPGEHQEGCRQAHHSTFFKDAWRLWSLITAPVCFPREKSHSHLSIRNSSVAPGQSLSTTGH